jgi:hypothetical protein
MRLSITLDDDVYAAAKSLARAKEVSIAKAVNDLIRRGLEPKGPPAAHRKGGLPVVRCARRFTSEDVAAAESELS